MKEKPYILIFTFVVMVVFTTFVTGVRILYAKRIAANQALKEKRWVLIVLGYEVTTETSAEEIASLYEKYVRQEEREGAMFYEGSEEGGNLKGHAFPIGGAGFWGPVSGVVGVDASFSKILGIAFPRHGETPGLGGEISQPWFMNQFKGKVITEEVAPGKYIRFVPPGAKTGQAEVNAITGASQTSYAVERFLNAEIGRYRQVILAEGAEKEK